MLVHLPNERTAGYMRLALTRQLAKLPTDLRRTLTWNQGKEMAEHVRFTIDTDIDVYCCDPHSPWPMVCFMSTSREACPQHLHRRRSRRGGQAVQRSPSANARMNDTLRDVSESPR